MEAPTFRNLLLRIFTLKRDFSVRGVERRLRRERDAGVGRRTLLANLLTIALAVLIITALALNLRKPDS